MIGIYMTIPIYSPGRGKPLPYDAGRFSVGEHIALPQTWYDANRCKGRS